MSEPQRAMVPTVVLVLLVILVSPGLEPIQEPSTNLSPIRASEGVPYFSPNIGVTDGTSPFPHQVEPYIVVDEQDRLFVGWKEAWTADGPGRRVGFARSTDGGLTWTENTLMDLRVQGRFQSDPWLALDELGRLYYSRLEYSQDLQSNGVMVSRSDDGGETWDSILNVDDQPGFADKESMVSDSNGTMYIAYDDVPSEGDNVSIRFARSSTTDHSWSPTTEVGGVEGGFVGPVMAPRPNGTVHVAWLDWGNGNVLVSTSWNRGLSWEPPVRVNVVPGTARYNEAQPWWTSLPSTAMSSTGSLFVAWPDRAAGSLDVVISRSDDGGATWTEPVRINDDTLREQRMVAIVVDGADLLHAAWYDNRTGDLNVFYSNSSDGGGTWSANTRVTTAETSRNYVRPGDYLGLAADRNGTAYVVWTDGRGGDLDIYFARSSPPKEPDTEAPLIEILSPEEGQIFTSTQLTVSGTAQDNVAVDRVEVSSDNGTTWIRANGTSAWSGLLEVPLGERTILARATDTSDNAATTEVTVSVVSADLLAPETLYLIGLVVAFATTIVVIAWLLARRRKR